MGQKITIRIAEREYVMNAPTAEDEENIRQAATEINRKISAYLDKYPGRIIADLLSFVALNESIGNITLQRKLNALKSEAATLGNEMKGYIEDMEKNSR